MGASLLALAKSIYCYIITITIIFLILKLIDKYNTIYNFNQQRMHYKTKIKETDKIQLVYRMLQLLITKKEYLDR